MLYNNFKTKLVAKIILVFQRNKCVVIGKNCDAFRQMFPHTFQIEWSSQPMAVGFLRFWIVFQTQKMLEETGDKHGASKQYFTRLALFDIKIIDGLAGITLSARMLQESKVSRIPKRRKQDFRL